MKSAVDSGYEKNKLQLLMGLDRAWMEHNHDKLISF